MADEKVGKKKKKERPFWEEWFTDHEVLYIPADKRRDVILNPGRTEEWFKKVYPVIGEVKHTRQVFLPDLPRNMKGKIIAVSANPTIKKHEFREMAEKTPYMQLQHFLKAKPIGTYYELFESGGYRVWTNPTEYYEPGSRRASRRKNKRVPTNFKSSGVKIGQLKDLAKGFRSSDGDSDKNNSTS